MSLDASLTDPLDKSGAHTTPRTIPAIALLGPTASGKSGLALAAASEGLPIEIISLDSALVYKDMDIGTAKPLPQELNLVPHHLIDILTPEEVFNASDFAQACLALVNDIRSRGKVPLIVGGTMMYYKTLVCGIDELPATDPAVRKQIELEAQQKGWPVMHAQLAQFDPVTATRLHATDSQRIGRALEVYRMTGHPLSSYHNREKSPEKSLPTLSLEPSERGILHDRIAQRFKQMIHEGLIDELHRLRSQYQLNPGLPSMRCVGYRQAWSYIEGELDMAHFTEAGIAATRQLAKRQLTWLRSTSQREVLDPFEPGFQHRALDWLRSKVEDLLP